MTKTVARQPTGGSEHEVVVVGARCAGAATATLLAPRRYVLDTILASAAVEAGASFQSGVSVTATITDTWGRVVGVTVRDGDGSTREIRGGMVVGADGVR